MWELDCEESWALNNWCFWTVVLEKTLESPLDCKEIQPVHPKGDQSWVFIGRTDAKAETPVLWPPHVKSWLTAKDPDAGRDWGQEEKGMTEDEMAGWHHRLDGHESEWTPGVGDGQGSLVCCDLWVHKELDTTEWLNWTDLKLYIAICTLLRYSPYISLYCCYGSWGGKPQRESDHFHHTVSRTLLVTDDGKFSQMAVAMTVLFLHCAVTLLAAFPYHL